MGRELTFCAVGQAYLSKLGTDFDEIFWRGGRGPRTNRLDFGSDGD